MATPPMERNLPTGFRALTPDEIAMLDSTLLVLMLDRETGRVTRWSVESYNGQWSRWTLGQSSQGEVVDTIALYDDGECDPACYTAVTLIDANDLETLLRASMYPTEAEAVVGELLAVEETQDEERRRAEYREEYRGLRGTTFNTRCR